MSRTIAPGALIALKDALTSIYWYKSDLRSFLSVSLTNSPEILARANWSSVKRAIVSDLVDALASRQDEYQGQLLNLMSHVAEMNDFSHLARLEDGKEKAEKAKSAVAALREWVEPHEELMLQVKEAEQRRRATYEESLQNQAVRVQLDNLREAFFEVVDPNLPQDRGYKLERLLRDLFELFDLDPRASFRNTGEQIDGAFTFDNTDFLLEAKWQKQLVDTSDLDAFKGKIQRKLENTLGVFLAVNGYSQNAIAVHSTSRPVMFLLEGSDLMAVLEGRIDLLQLLLRKRRHAAQTGEILLPIHRILTE